MHRVATLLLCLALPACYAYEPVSRLDAPTPGGTLRLTLTDSGSVVLAARVGPAVTAIDGRLVADSAGTYILVVTNTVQRDGAENDWNGEHLAIALPLVAGVGERRFSIGRTLVFGGIATAALVAATVAFRGAGGATVAGPTPGGPGTGK